MITRKRNRLYEIGTSVRVVDGVCDPDYPDVDIGGWQGRVFEVSEDEEGKPLLGILWDSVTLQQMPRNIVKRAATEGNDFSVMYLHAKELKRSSPRDTTRDVLRIAEEIENTID